MSVDILMENFEEIAFLAEDIYYIRLSNVDIAFPSSPYPNHAQFYKAYDRVEIIINEQANNCRRSPFHRPYSHSMNPFDRLIDGSDIVALTLIYDDYIDIPAVLNYSKNINALTIYVPYQECDNDKHINKLQNTMKDSNGRLKSFSSFNDRLPIIIAPTPSLHIIYVFCC
ncbi:hypothetical protein [Selenomonas sp. ND2010]|uniref:hypothetical protein n=1 Tax=Selenomonas sp. ND2010 TaxID=1410618 RepID=UPI0012DF23CF|nr:hypothetical protein [Selenomonas sp. ND2010]